MNAVTFPLDITKTRLQIQGQKEQWKGSGVYTDKKGSRAYRGMLRTLIGISTKDCNLRVIPCEINTKNWRMFQISLKFCTHIVYVETWNHNNF